MAPLAMPDTSTPRRRCRPGAGDTGRHRASRELRARAADCGKLLITVEVELDFAFTPPTTVVDTPGQVGADVVSRALDSVDISRTGEGVTRSYIVEVPNCTFGLIARPTLP